MRQPRIINKYNIKPQDIESAIILRPEALHKAPFWRNDVVKAWCLSGGAGEGFYGPEDTYWIGFYDQDAPAYADKIRLSCTSHEDMCSYNFKNFFKQPEIENDADLEIQEKLLETINWLLDEEIISIDKIGRTKSQRRRIALQNS